MTTDNIAPDAQDQTSAPAPQEPQPTEQPSKGTSEAAKYRTQLRATEAERDTLTGRLEAAHRTMVESIAGKTLAKPEALWKTGTKLEDLLDDDGNVDPEKVTAAATAAVEDIGLMKRLNGPIVPRQGDSPEPYAGMRKESFSDAFGPR